MPTNSHDAPIDSRVEVHDSNAFEVKLDYAIDTDKRRAAYHIDTWFFVPRSTGINPGTYPKAQFYADVQSYIRFKTPTRSLASLVDPDNAASPLTRVAALLPELHRHSEDADLAERIGRELRLFGCLVRTNLRDQTAGLVAALERAGPGVAALAERMDAFVRDLGVVTERFRDLQDRCLVVGVPADLQEVYRLVDEYVCFVVEGNLTRLVQALDEHGAGAAELADARATAVEALLDARARRKERANVGGRTAPGREERFTYRRGFLKKFVMSVLFLDVTRATSERRARDVVAAIAAGVAMLFSTAAALWSQASYGVNSVPFVVALIVAYMLKDRIKEWLKGWFTHKMTPWLADHVSRIRDEAQGTTVGRCREAFAFMPPERVPPEVLATRRAGAPASLEATVEQELVMKYGKDVFLHARTIGQTHGRLHDVHDIIRFNVAAFQARMDDPGSVVPTYDAERDAVTDVVYPKTYHLNVVLVLRSLGERRPTAMHHVRVVLDKSGIVRLEEVGHTTVPYRRRARI